MGIISISQILVVWFIPESPRWLLFHYKVERAKKLLTKIAKVNNKDVEIDIKIVEGRKVLLSTVR